ncbi:MAG: 5-(carboxyamino)imidazole ribonucleotide mutase, partial [Flavobacteriales bacterium]|nr:5-(carboxyamino)imidazole ribonucleotide mutase [Flavobacteriales bacterium]
RNSIDGWDSLLSMAQMPNGVPVATMAVNSSRNAGLLAVRILALSYPEVARRAATFRQSQHDKVRAGIDVLKQHFPNRFDK